MCKVVSLRSWRLSWELVTIEMNFCYAVSQILSISTEKKVYTYLYLSVPSLPPGLEQEFVLWCKRRRVAKASLFDRWEAGGS